MDVKSDYAFRILVVREHHFVLHVGVCHINVSQTKLSPGRFIKKFFFA